MTEQEKFIRMIQISAMQQGVDPDIAVQVARQESGFNPEARSPKGALGLMQLMPDTAKRLGVNPYDPAENIEGGVRYLKQQQNRFGSTEKMLAAYNAGPGAVEKYGGVPPYKETKNYVQRIMGFVGPGRAEAATPDQDRARRIQELEESLKPPPAAPPAAPAARAPDQDRARRIQELEESLRQEPATATPPPATPPPAAPPPAAPPPPGTAAPPAPDASTQVDLLRSQEQQRLAAERAVGSPTRQAPTREALLKGAAATGISAAGSVVGTAAGTLVAPFTGPLAPAMPVVGEMAGSYGARKLNVALGLEEPGVVGDVASVALPGLTGLPSVVRGIKTWTKVPQKAREMVQAAKEADIPLTYGEATGSPMVKRAEEALEKVPFVGTGGFRERQQAAVKAAAERTVQAQQQVMTRTPWEELPTVEAAAAQGSKQAQRVLDSIANAGDDWNRIVQASGNLKAFRAKQVSNTLYGDVATLAEPLGNVPMKTTLTTIDDTLKALRTAVVPDTETIRYLEQIKTGLQGQTSTTVSPLLNAAGAPITKTVTTPGKTTYGQLRQFRSDLGDTISDYYRGSNAVVGAKGVGSLAKVKTALEQDLDTFAMQSPVPELQNAALAADKHYKTKVIPYEDQMLATALKSDTPDEIYGKFIQRDHRDRATKFYHALDARGKAAVQYGMVVEAQQKALDPTTGAFSPAKFDGSLKAIQDARGVFFTGTEKFKLDGLMKVMRAAERAGYYTENPPTGQRVIPLLLGGHLLGAGAQAVVNVAATVTLSSWLLTSKTGTGILLRAHSVAEKSFAMDQLMRQLETQGARVLAQKAGEVLQPGQQVQVQPGRVRR